MKKIILAALPALMFSLFAGCGDAKIMDSKTSPIPTATMDLMPNASDGLVTDTDGLIGDIISPEVTADQNKTDLPQDSADVNETEKPVDAGKNDLGTNAKSR